VDIGINFRGTAGYVTDGTNQTYCLSTDSYPTTRGGVTFGWESTDGEGRDRSTTVGPELAGINYANNTSSVWRLDLDATGDYEVHVAAGDQGGFNDCLWDLIDDATVFQSITNGAGFLSPGEFKDATDTLRTTAADWLSNEQPYERTFGSTIFRVQVRTPATGRNNVLAHVQLVSTGGGGGQTFNAAWCANTNKVQSVSRGL
jgi:hypothetical protein